MKKTIIALSVFAFVFAMAGESLKAMTTEISATVVNYTGDKDPAADGTKKAAKADKKAAAAASGKTKSASSGDCSKSCDKSAKTSGDCGSKKTTSAEAIPAPETK